MSGYERKKIIEKSIIKGILAFIALLIFFFSILSLANGFGFALAQFTKYWYFILPIMLGFGTQLGLYSFAKSSIKNNLGATATVSTSGGISGASMVACCAHFIPQTITILGATIGLTGIASALALSMKYQKLFFAIGIISNLVGIFIMLGTIKKHNL